MKTILAAIAAVGLAIPTIAVAADDKKTGKDYAPGQNQTEQKRANELAPGQRKKPGESAKEYAPGQKAQDANEKGDKGATGSGTGAGN